MPEVALTRCGSYGSDDVAAAVEEALSSALDVTGGRLEGERILVKPNLLSAKDPGRGITTHPAVVGAVIDYLRRRGAEVSVGDSPGGAVRGVERVWATTGMLQLARQKGVNLVNFEATGWVERSIEGRTYQIAKAVLDFDRIVSLPKLKTHILTLLTASIKNTFGCVPGFRKSALHLAYPRPDAMSRVLVDIHSIVSPWVTLVDAVEAMEGNGPSSGKIKHLGFLAASTDSVAVDTVLARIVGIDPVRVPTNREAYERGLGEASCARISFPILKPDDLKPGDFAVPSNWKFFLIPNVLARFLARFVWVRPEVDPERCAGCGECCDICPTGAIRLARGKALIDDDRCTSCLCCQEICTVGAVYTRMSRLARLLA
jgi:uncharacterized protein (DUF362 family)/Pyruvate/2-oxoacid:ferredoxin oxidoreductase delta subunit